MSNTKPIGVAYEDQKISGGTVDNTLIGSLVPSTGVFTNITCANITSTQSVKSGPSTAAISKSSGNINEFYGTATNTSGDVRAIYTRLNFTGAGGSGETLRAFTTVAAAVAVGGTVNGAHISLSVNSGGSVSGAGNALRVTLGAAASVTPGGTLAVIQVDSDISGTATMPATLSFLRFTNSNTGTIPNLLRVPNALVVSHVAADSTHSIKIINESGTAYYLMATTVAP